MAPIASTGHLTTTTTFTYVNPRTNFSLSASVSITTTTRHRTNTVRSSSPQNPKPLITSSLKNLLSIFAASGIIHTLASRVPSLIRQDVSASMAIEDPEEEEWDHHGLPVGKKFQLSKLSRFKKYKLGEISFTDQKRKDDNNNNNNDNINMNSSLFEMMSLRAGGVYTKAQLQKELENLHTCGLFKKVNVEGKYNPDGSIGLTVSFVGSTWEAPERVKCINVGLMPQADWQKEMQAAYMNKEELQEYMRFQKWDYERRMGRSRPCLLPGNVLREVSDMLRKEGNLTAQLLQKIRGRVQKWYHDQGFACAQVVNFENLNTQEIVCEVVEGDITGLVVQFQDKHGNVCEGGNKQFGMVREKLLQQLREGSVFNMEAAKQALLNLNSPALFSNIELGPRPDGKKEGGVIVEIKLKEY